MSARKIPGFPPHITSLLVPQEVFGHESSTPIDILLENHVDMTKRARDANGHSVERLEKEMDALDVDSEMYQEDIERICDRIAELEEDGDDGDGSGGNDDDFEERARYALGFFGVPETDFATPTARLSGGIRKKVALASALMERPQLLLLDEPTCHIDVSGILQLRRLVADFVESCATVVMVSHDVDLMNDVGTDVIDFRDGKLGYHVGTYRDFLRFREERIMHQARQAGALEKQRASMMRGIDNLKKKSSQSDSVTARKKIHRAVKSKEKKLERHGVEKNESGHRRTAQADGGIRKGSINSIDADRRGKMTHRELVKLAEIDVGPVPDKAVQFDFRDATSTWGDEPLVSVMDVGYGYDGEVGGGPPNLVFDCVDLSIREGSRTTILGENGSGKTSLLSIIAGETTPSVGSVHFATGVGVGYFRQHSVDNLLCNIGISADGEGMVTPLSFLMDKFPSKPEQEVRGELTRFGLSPKQAGTNVRFLSGGERCRMCMVSIALESPQLLVIDEISNHLDVESVEALIYGLRKWKGTVVMASHDANLIREVGGECYVLFDGRLRRLEGIDSYLRIFAKYHHRPQA